MPRAGYDRRFVLAAALAVAGAAFASSPAQASCGDHVTVLGPTMLPVIKLARDGGPADGDRPCAGPSCGRRPASVPMTAAGGAGGRAAGDAAEPVRSRPGASRPARVHRPESDGSPDDPVPVPIDHPPR